MKVESKRAKSSQRKTLTTTVTWLKEHASHVAAPLLLAALRTILRVQQRRERKAAKHQAWLDAIEAHQPEVKKANLHYEPAIPPQLEGKPDSWLRKTVTRAGKPLGKRTKR